MRKMDTNRDTQLQEEKQFSIVAIGASAGGLEAVCELLKHLPADTGMAYIYIQNLDSDYDNDLIDTLSRVTIIPVKEARDRIKVEPDHVYVIPPGWDMMLADGMFRLSVPHIRRSFMPVNQFFTSLAEKYKERVIGIILSGNITDGAIGLKAIKTAGGIAFAQDHTARFQSMPKNAIAEDAVDLVLSPKKMADELAKIALQQEVYRSAIEALTEEVIADRDEDLLQLLKQIHNLTGVDFTQYKVNTIKRRIIRRMILHKMDNFKQYAAYAKHHINEINQLYQDFLINVTEFFRDKEATDYLRKVILPKLVKDKMPSDAIRIWVPACSTGQEAYSLAILMMEVLGEKATNNTVQIFATDLSESAINKARLGIYSKDEVAGLDPKVLNSFFTKLDGSYRIIKSIRDLCVFANHNVTKDPPFSKVDLVSCCNLLIYLENALQKKIINTFHYALNPYGYLVLGKSETIGTSITLFTQLDKRYKVYAKKKDAAARAMFEMNYRHTEAETAAHASGRKLTMPKEKTNEPDLDRIVDQILLKKYMPASVVVNSELDILQFRGATGLFLEPAPGKASLNLMKMARPALSFELRNLVLKAEKNGEPEQKTWIDTSGKKPKKISIEAVPLQGEGLEQFFLVLFSEELIEGQENLLSTSKDKRVKQLENELNAMREDMRAVVEAQEAANEELQSVNEEIVSSNEELQSINEELETSKEELESSNEELLTINQELSMRNEQLAEVQEYSEAMFATIRESLLILDKNLRIKNANSCFYKTFHVSEEETQGKLLYDIGNKQWDIPRLRELLEEIIPRNSQVSNFEVRHQFQHIGEKVMLLNARRLVRKTHNEHLILLAIEDITEYRQSQKKVEEREAWFRNTANNAPVMIWIAGADRRIGFVNDAWLEYRSATLEESIGKSWMEDMHPQDEKICREVYEQSFQQQKSFVVEYRLKHKDGSYRRILSRGKPNYDPGGNFIGFIGSCMELPQQYDDKTAGDLHF